MNTIYHDIKECLSEAILDAQTSGDQRYIIRYGGYSELMDLWTLQAQGRHPDITVFPDGHLYKDGEFIH